MLKYIAIFLVVFAKPVSAEVETVTTDGTTWTAATWGYNSPKLLYDGKQLYAVALVGSGIDHDVARMYWRDAAGWHAGADITPIYQPATILLDERGHINVFCTDHGTRAYHWRSTHAGDVSKFESVDLPAAERFGYGYLGAGRNGSLVALAGLDQNYAMWISIKRSFDAAWEKPRLLAESRKDIAPFKSPVYPIVLPTASAVDVIFSNCPDGSVHNTYDHIELAHFDLATNDVTQRAVIAQGPLGEMTFGLDALRLPDGSIAVLYLAGLHVYGDIAPEIEKRRGLFCARSPDGITWTRTHVCESTGTGQLHLRSDGEIDVLQSSSTGILQYHSRTGGAWTADAKPVADSIGAFMYVIKNNSGSVPSAGIRAVQSCPVANPMQGTAKYRLDYIDLGGGRR